VDDAIAACRTAMAEGGAERINSATDALMRASHRVAEVLYRSGAPAGAAGATGGDQPGTHAGGSSQQGDVIDAEYVDVDENKKPNA
jgi:molecular chaperone DnaK